MASNSRKRLDTNRLAYVIGLGCIGEPQLLMSATARLNEVQWAMLIAVEGVLPFKFDERSYNLVSDSVPQTNRARRALVRHIMAKLWEDNSDQ